MRGVALLVCLVALLSFSAAQDITIWKELLTVDCNGGTHMLDSSIPFVLQTSVLNTTINFVVEKTREAVNCKCPIPSQLSEQEFERRFVPGVAAALNMAKGKNMLVGDLATCPLSDFARSFNDINFIDVNLPTSCSLEQWEAGNPCLVQYNLPSRFDLSLQLAVDKCPNSYLPYVSLTCAGLGCTDFFKPCQADSDCGGKFQCNIAHTNTTANFLTELYNTLVDMYIYDYKDMYPGCYSVSSVIDSLSKIALSYFTTTVPTTPFSDLKFCGFDFLNVTSMGDDFASCNVTQTLNEECNLVDTHYSINCPNLASWNGILPDSSSATSTARKAGSPFTQFSFPAALGTSPVVSLLQATCDGSYSVMGTELYAFSVGLNPTSLVQSFYTLLRSTQDCRSPMLTLNQFRAAWEMWAADFYGYLYTSPQPSIITTRSTFLSLFGDEVSSRLILPSTCTLEVLQETGVCAVKWSGLQDLLNIDVTIRGKMRRCASNPEGVPEMYVECEGTDCAALFRPTLCTSSTQCGPNFVCQNLASNFSLTYNNYNPLGLLLWGVDNNTLASCPSDEMDVIPPTQTCSTSLASYYTLLRDAISLITGIPSTVNTGISICTFDFNAVVNNGNDWATNMVINQGPDYSLTDMVEWTDAFSVPPAGSTGSTSTSSSSGATTQGTSAASTMPIFSGLAAIMAFLIFGLF